MENVSSLLTPPPEARYRLAEENLKAVEEAMSILNRTMTCLSSTGRAPEMSVPSLSPPSGPNVVSLSPVSDWGGGQASRDEGRMGYPSESLPLNNLGLDLSEREDTPCPLTPAPAADTLVPLPNDPPEVLNPPLADVDPSTRWYVVIVGTETGVFQGWYVVSTICSAS